jgi:hypothetical protein
MTAFLDIPITAPTDELFARFLVTLCRNSIYKTTRLAMDFGNLVKQQFPKSVTEFVGSGPSSIRQKLCFHRSAS